MLTATVIFLIQTETVPNFARRAMKLTLDYEASVRAVIPSEDWFEPVMEQVNEWAADDQADY